jgi:hypothetical protein
MTMRIVAGCGLAVGLLTALSACAPAYYPGYPGYPPYYGRPAYSPAYQSGTRTLPRPEEPQRGGTWINPEPAR